MKSAWPCGIVLLIFTFSVASVVANTKCEMVPWGVERIGARSLWDKDWNMVVDNGAYSGNYIVVAVIDTGIDLNHPDLQDNIAGGAYVYYNASSPSGASASENPSEYNDTNGHGTKVAGVVSAVDNDLCVIGAAPHAGIFAIKLEIGDPRYPHPEVDAYGIRYAADKSYINIIVLPWMILFPDRYDPNHKIESACSYAFSQGKLIVSGLGNDNADEVYYPANVSSVVAVGTTDENDERWTDSNYGPELDFVAPGANINLTNLGGGYTVESGTSYSCPYVAAAAALIFEAYPYIGFSNEDAWVLLNYTVHDLGASGWDEQFGMGLVNAYRPCQLPEGDVSGDNMVNIFDAAIVAVSFGSVPGEADWNAVADINIDKVIDIFDIVRIALDFGQEI